MKNLFVVSILFFTALTIGFSQGKESVSLENIPSEINAYVTHHFSATSIKDAYKEKESTPSFVYEINLKNGVELTFNSFNQIIEIESKQALPESVVPAEIKKYVTDNYSGAVIKEWSLKSNDRQEIGLNNGKDLIFDKNGMFLAVGK